MNTELIKQIGQAMIDDPESGFEEFEYWHSAATRAAAKSWEELIVCGLPRQISIRRKPKTITRTVTIPEPYRGEMKLGQKYFVAAPVSSHWFLVLSWANDNVDLRYMKRGFAYLTKEDAIAAAKAMVGGER